MHTHNFRYQRDDIIQNDECLYTVELHVYSDVFEEAYLAAALCKNVWCKRKCTLLWETIQTPHTQTILYMEKIEL